MGFSPGRNCDFPRISCPGLSYVRLLESVELILVNARFSPVPRVLNAAVAPNATKAASNAYSTRSWPLCFWIHLRTPANDLNMRAFIIYPPKEFSRASIETPDTEVAAKIIAAFSSGKRTPGVERKAISTVNPGYPKVPFRSIASAGDLVGEILRTSPTLRR